METKKHDKLVKIKKKQTHSYREQTNGCQWGEGREEGKYRGRGVGCTNY